MNGLFEITPVEKEVSKLTCLSCEHRERHAAGLSVFQYCGIRKSKRTENGLLKIKCKTPACLAYTPINSPTK